MPQILEQIMAVVHEIPKVQVVERIKEQSVESMVFPLELMERINDPIVEASKATQTFDGVLFLRHMCQSQVGRCQGRWESDTKVYHQFHTQHAHLPWTGTTAATVTATAATATAGVLGALWRDPTVSWPPCQARLFRVVKLLDGETELPSRAMLESATVGRADADGVHILGGKELGRIVL